MSSTTLQDRIQSIASKSEMLEALRCIGVEVTEYDEGAYSSLEVHGEGQAEGGITADSVFVTVNHETLVIKLSEHENVPDFLRTVDYSLRYMMMHRYSFPQAVPATFQTGQEIQE